MVLFVAELDEYLDRQEVHQKNRGKRPREPTIGELLGHQEITTRARQSWRGSQIRSMVDDGADASRERTSCPQEQPPSSLHHGSSRAPKVPCLADSAGLERPRAPRLRIPSLSSLVLGSEKLKWQCHHCRAQQTPQIRTGPHDPRTLCNACGVRYKTGRLVAGYRPAGSPYFGPEMPSSYHPRKTRKRSGSEAGKENTHSRL